MKTIKFKEKQISVPESWQEVTLRMQMEAETNTKILSDELGLIALVAAYCNLPIGMLKKENVGIMNEIISHMEFINKDYTVNPSIRKFEYMGETYYIKEELEKTEFQDWLSIQAVLHNNKENPIMGLSKIVAIMAKKEGETLDDFDLDERGKLFQNLSITIVKDIESFFLSKIDISKLHTVLSSKGFSESLLLLKFQELSNLINRLREQSGIFSPTRFVIFLLKIYLWFIKKRLVKYFNFTPSKQYMTNSRKTWWKSIWRFRKRK